MTYSVEIVAKGRPCGPYEIEADSKAQARARGLLRAIQDGLELLSEEVSFFIDGEESPFGDR